jgi:hypothetical protein
VALYVPIDEEKNEANEYKKTQMHAYEIQSEEGTAIEASMVPAQ